MVVTKENIHLHILGEIDNSRYVKSIQRLCNRHKDWAFMEGRIVGVKKQGNIARHKFGISGCENESFGIAVAEMVKGGCIVWVPNGGGQVEIVNHPMLIYDSMEDAADKIENVLKDDILQAELRKHLAIQSKKFSHGRFISETKEVIHQFLENDNRMST